MGWDCHPTRNGRLLRHDRATHHIYDQTLRAAIQQAAQDARRMAGDADMLIEYGALHLRECADMLHQATGLNPYTLEGWTPAQVQTANWDFNYLKTRRAAYWSARKFLETCAAHQLGVKFSY